MSRRALVVLVLLAVLATGGGVAAGLVIARAPAPPPAEAAPATTAAPLPTLPPGEEPTTSSSTAPSSTTTSTTLSELTVRARLVQRREDGLVVRYDASQPVSAVLAWGFGGPSGNQVAFPGPSRQGTATVPLAKTIRAVSMRVIGRAADGRQGVSRTLTARRLVRQVVLEVRALSLDIPSGTAGIATGFLGTTYTPLGPGASGPTAASEPFAFPSVALAAGAGGSPLALRFIRGLPPQQQTRVVNVAITYPSPGTAVTLNRNVTALGLTAHLTLRVRVTRS
jgi:hypothetical protein